jgi:hypothetical protein
MSGDEEIIYSTYSKTPTDESEDVDSNGEAATAHAGPGRVDPFFLLFITFYHSPECSPSMNTCCFWDFMPSKSSST